MILVYALGCVLRSRGGERCKLGTWYRPLLRPQLGIFLHIEGPVGLLLADNGGAERVLHGVIEI